MVKRVISCLFIVLLICCFSLPAFAYDTYQSDSDLIGFSYDNSGIIWGKECIDGNLLSVDSQSLTVHRFYFYIPCFVPCKSVAFDFDFLELDGSPYMAAVDYGNIYSNDYHYYEDLSNPGLVNSGFSTITGSNARNVSRRCVIYPNFTTNEYTRYIRLTISYNTSGNPFKLVTYFNKDLSVSLTSTGTYTGTNRIVPGSGTFSGSVVQSDHNIILNSGNLLTQEAYLYGSLRSYYASNSYNNVVFNQSSTSPYVRIPALAVRCNSSNSLGGKVSGQNMSESGTITLNNMTGTQSGDSSATISGTNVQRDYAKTVQFNVTRAYSDEDVITSINNASNRNHTDITNAQTQLHTDITYASDRNHTDITNAQTQIHSDLSSISEQMQEIIDHQEGLEQQGQAINSTTSQSTISDTSSTVNSGTSAVSNMAGSVASNVNSTSSEYTGYLGFLGDGMEVMFNHLQPLYIWFGACFLIPMILWMFRHATSGGDD